MLTSEQIEYNLDLLESGCLLFPPYSGEFNCASFVRCICGIPDEGSALSLQIADLTERPIQYMRRGDICFSRNFGHCGVSLGYPYVAHYTKEGLQVSSYIKDFAQGWAYGN